jgi:uncharacterized protein YccT (UPF0319 family)
VDKKILTVVMVLLLVFWVIGCTSGVTPRSYETPTRTLSPPSEPVNLSASAVSQSTVMIRWLDNSNNEDGFRIYRGNSLVGTLGANVQSYQDKGLQQGTTYHYAVKAYNQAGESQAATCSVSTPAPPSAPTNLITVTISQDAATLSWTDNSDNEEGFKIYRDSNLVANVSVNVITYEDTGLQAATDYRYLVKAYNEIGETQSSLCVVKTLNPPITVRLDRIGVYDNGEYWLRGECGEVYVYVVVSDGKKTTERMRFPQQEGQYYELKKNETVDIGTAIFSTGEVGDRLTITVIGYECDGGAFEQLVYDALGAAVTGGGGGLLDLFGISLGGLIGKFFGSEDDWLGSYEGTWNSSKRWGIGKYADIACQEEDGTLGLRVWFTIK